jgi:ATP-dependent Clp protease adapter protein ClpS
MTLLESLVQADLKQEQTAGSREDEATVLLHDDPITPAEYSIRMLEIVFELSNELAEHIVWVACTTGTAPVITCRRERAQRLVNEARLVAQLDGFRSSFDLAQDVATVKTPLRKTAIPFVSSVILLLCAVGIAVADGAGGFPL